MKIAICDDENDYRNLLKKYVTFFCGQEKIDVECFEFSSGEDLINSSEKYDMAFLDIEMGGLNGIEAAKELTKRNSKTIIFIVTAYNKYLDDAMDLNVFRYLDKPVSADRIYAGLKKAMEIINDAEITFVTKGNDIIKVHKSKIIYVENQKRNALVVTEDGNFISKEKIEYFKEKLNASYFVVPHNSYIVNLNYVRKYTRSVLYISGEIGIPISQNKQPEMRERFIRFIQEDYDGATDSF